MRFAWVKVALTVTISPTPAKAEGFPNTTPATNARHQPQLVRGKIESKQYADSFAQHRLGDGICYGGANESDRTYKLE